MTDEPVVVAGVEGTVRVGSGRSRTGELVGGTLALAPWEGVIGAAPPASLNDDFSSMR